MNRPVRHILDGARIGPEAVSCLGDTLMAHGERSLAGEIYLAAGRPDWLAKPPEGLIDERIVARLLDALQRSTTGDLALAYVAEAGMRTADHVLAHRLSRATRMSVRLLPSPIAGRIVLEAIETHAQCLAGSGRLSHVPGAPAVLSISGNPLATGTGCIWHAALLRRLFQSLVHPCAEVRETACCGAGDPVCRFEIRWPGPAALP